VEKMVGAPEVEDKRLSGLLPMFILVHMLRQRTNVPEPTTIARLHLP